MKRVGFLLVAIILLATAPVASALGVAHKDIKVTLNKADGIYAIGDSAKVYGQCLQDLGPLRLTVFDGHHKIVDSLLVFGSDTTARVIFSELCTKAEGILVILGPDGDEQNVTSAGFVVAPDTIVPGFEAPDDLYSWWEREIKAMRRSRMKVVVEPVDTPKEYEEDVECWHVSISMPEGPAVQAYVAMPYFAKKKSLPIFIGTHGATALNSKSTRSNLKSACKYAAKGAIAANVNALGILDNEPQAYYDALMKSELKGYGSRPLTTREEFFFRLMFLRLERLLDYLCSFKEWDRTRVMVYGGSQGGAQALFLAGVDRRVSHCVAMVPAMTDFGGTLQGRASAWPKSYAEDGVAATSPGKDVLPYFDGSLLIRRFTGKLYLEAGFIDTTCPPTCIYATYNNAVAASEKTIMPYVYRRHCCVDPPYSEHWSETVVARRKAFVAEFMK